MSFFPTPIASLDSAACQTGARERLNGQTDIQTDRNSCSTRGQSSPPVTTNPSADERASKVRKRAKS
ncbi:hypothetical protein T265_04398 [Opisthorchis viverrini]|uniref:Uncharacterized protein n=1 Tax=Opisthorchis viverrini TaxID=6198 RepID=A0A074ZN80_OPIVI|nr:hypothetical protein T265_04398 [Opisthorchis viverrini]KER28858.1 hypothetical protein T265_04398 [Opisthorchis viverrini]